MVCFGSLADTITDPPVYSNRLVLVFFTKQIFSIDGKGLLNMHGLILMAKNYRALKNRMYTTQ